jgi:thiol:disulfide interchange protein DsbC
MSFFSSFARSLAGVARGCSTAALLALLATQVSAQEATIRKNLQQRLPALPAIDEVRETPVKGLYEIRLGHDVLYVDASGNYLIQGELVDLQSKVNLTQQRVAALSAIDVQQLPLKDAFVTRRGKGQRKLVVFADPNCGYCKQFESELAKVDNVTIYTFLYPILGADSSEKSRRIWCAAQPAKVWTDWMLRAKPIPAAQCSKEQLAAIERNVEFGRKHKIEGTPMLLFADGQRVPGALSAAQIEELLKAAASRQPS